MDGPGVGGLGGRVGGKVLRMQKRKKVMAERGFGTEGRGVYGEE